MPDLDTFRCLALAYEAGRTGGTAPAILSASNEVAVAAFLDGVIGFEGIPRTIKRVVDETTQAHPESIKQVLQIDAEARAFAAEVTRRERPLAPALGVYTH